MARPLQGRNAGFMGNSVSVVPAGLAELLRRRDGVVSTPEVLTHLSPAVLRWRLASGRWQQPCRGVVIAHSGPLSPGQQLWAALLWGGQGALLAGLTAAHLDGLRGFTERRIHVLLPAARQVRGKPIALPLVVHRSRWLDDSDVHPVRQPPRTRLARSLVDAAAWATTDDRARAVLAAGVQQRLVRPVDLMAVTARTGQLRRRQLIRTTATDVMGGAQALSELDLTALLRRYGIPSRTGKPAAWTSTAGGAGWTPCGKRPG